MKLARSDPFCLYLKEKNIRGKANETIFKSKELGIN